MVVLTDAQRTAYTAELEALIARRSERILEGTETAFAHGNNAGNRSLSLQPTGMAVLEREINRLQRLLGLAVETYTEPLRPFVPSNYER